jgi:hypothetical protein
MVIAKQNLAKKAEKKGSCTAEAHPEHEKLAGSRRNSVKDLRRIISPGKHFPFDVEPRYTPNTLLSG